MCSIHVHFLGKKFLQIDIEQYAIDLYLDCFMVYVLMLYSIFFFQSIYNIYFVNCLLWSAEEKKLSNAIHFFFYQLTVQTFNYGTSLLKQVLIYISNKLKKQLELPPIHHTQEPTLQMKLQYAKNHLQYYINCNRI